MDKPVAALSSPSAQRNRGHILEVLHQYMPAGGTVLELASGTGQHAVHFANAFPDISWQATDLEEANMPVIQAWINQDATHGNLLPPMVLDVLGDVKQLSAKHYAAAFCANMIHISPPETVAGLFKLLAHALEEGGLLCLYGPFIEQGVETAASNLSFVQWLKSKDQGFGIRHKEDVVEEALKHGFLLKARHEMPANNLILVFQKKV